MVQIYATSEERKQRNRQAQAAFRERRTEYIKQLEETIRVHETNLHSLQNAHRHAADECLMLRYKNSLLERILLEKGKFENLPMQRCRFHQEWTWGFQLLALEDAMYWSSASLLYWLCERATNRA